MTTVKHPLVVMSTFLWIGFICAISFMEAWLKFSASGVTIAIGLGIGRLVFNALNKAEWVFCIAIFISYVSSKRELFSAKNSFYFITAILLIVQTVWLLPTLDARAELFLNNQPMQPSNLHFYYVAMEVVKVVCLSVFGIALFKTAVVTVK